MKIKINGNQERNWYIQDLDCYTSEFLQQIILSLVDGHFYHEEKCITHNTVEPTKVDSIKDATHKQSEQKGCGKLLQGKCPIVCDEPFECNCGNIIKDTLILCDKCNNEKAMQFIKDKGLVDEYLDLPKEDSNANDKTIL